MRPRLLFTLAGLIFTAAAAFAEAPAPNPLDLFAQASEAYSLRDWPRCIELFVQVAEKANEVRRAARSYFAAAACAAAQGDREGAFALLDQAAGKGYRDRERAAGNPKLKPLHEDPRWKSFLAGVEARAAAQEAKVNGELARLYREDQADRSQGPNAAIDWAAVSKRDAERRRRVLEIVEQGGARDADDYYHAAMVFQHGEQPEDYDRAHHWCLEALKLDPDHPSARWLAAATKDRALMWRGKPQLYGTQFKKVDGKWILWEVDPSVTDEERAKWDVPPLAAAKKMAEDLNGGG